MTNAYNTAGGLEVGTRIAALFPPAQGVLGRPGPNGRTRWGARFGYFSAARILAAYESGIRPAGPDIVALRFTDRTRFGVLDIDSASPFRTLDTFAALAAAANAQGLRLTLCRSSPSGGWHTYLWTDDFVASADMHAVLRRLAEDAGIDRFENGICEVYPDPLHARQALRLPCQAGFAWLSPLDGSVQYECAAEEPAANLRRLLDWIAEVAVPATGFAGAAARFASPAMAAKMPRGRPPKVVPPPKASKGLPAPEALHLQLGLVYRYDRNAAKNGKPPFESAAMARFREGERRYQEGLERPGSRNEALRSVAFFLFFVGYLAPTDRELLLIEWLRAKHNGQSSAWLDLEQRDAVLSEIRRLAVWRPTAERGTGAPRGTTPAHEERRRQNEALVAKAVVDATAQGESTSVRHISVITGLSPGAVAKILPAARAKIMR